MTEPKPHYYVLGKDDPLTVKPKNWWRHAATHMAIATNKHRRGVFYRTLASCVSVADENDRARLIGAFRAEFERAYDISLGKEFNLL